MKLNWDDDIPNRWKINQSCSSHQQPATSRPAPPTKARHATDAIPKASAQQKHRDRLGATAAMARHPGGTPSGRWEMDGEALTVELWVYGFVQDGHHMVVIWLSYGYTNSCKKLQVILYIYIYIYIHTRHYQTLFPGWLWALSSLI